MMNASLNFLQGAEPLFFRRGKVGCLCLHGFMASPAEIRWLCLYLAGQGYTVSAPCLPGHGTDHRDMARVRWQDWYAAALDSYHLLRDECEKVYIVGHSMGGLLALLVGANLPVDGLAVLAAPARFRSRMVQYAHLLRYFLPYTNQSDKSDLPEIIRAEQKRRGEPVLGRVRYGIWSTAAVSQLYRLAQVTYRHLPDVTAPLLLVYSKADKTVPLHDQETIASRVSSTIIQKHILERSSHILVQDVERDLVFEQVGEFVAACAVTTKL